MNKKISVIIPTYNSWHTLESCIHSILEQTVKPYEIIIINNASTDGTKEGLNKFSQIKQIHLEKNTGVTGGRNTGIKYATGDFLLFFDHDMIADKNMIQEMLSVSELNSKVGVVTPKIFYYDQKNIIWSAGTDINLVSGQNIFRSGEDIGQYNEDKEVSVAPATLLVKKEVIDKIQGFDDTYFAVYEDTDFCFRARQAGYLTYYAHKAVAYHKIPFDPDLSNRRLLERTYWIARNRVIFMKKFANNFWLFVPFLFVYLIYYLVLSFKYKAYSAIPNYIKGVIDGLKYKSYEPTI